MACPPSRLRQDCFLRPWHVAVLHFNLNFAQLLLLFLKQNLSSSSSQGRVFSVIINRLSVNFYWSGPSAFNPFSYFQDLCFYPKIKIGRKIKGSTGSHCELSEAVGNKPNGSRVRPCTKDLLARTLCYVKKEWKSYFYSTTGGKKNQKQKTTITTKNALENYNRLVLLMFKFKTSRCQKLLKVVVFFQMQEASAMSTHICIFHNSNVCGSYSRNTL